VPVLRSFFCTFQAANAPPAGEMVHGVRAEMAVRLADVVFGRTDLGRCGHPGTEALESAAELMAAELG
jgi:glycerol-3-phosphate dehydrogenase